VGWNLIELTGKRKHRRYLFIYLLMNKTLGQSQITPYSIFVFIRDPQGSSYSSWGPNTPKKPQYI
jgi:hypothetical protein